MKNFYNSALSALKRRLMPNVSNNLEEKITKFLKILIFRIKCIILWKNKNSFISNNPQLTLLMKTEMTFNELIKYKNELNEKRLLLRAEIGAIRLKKIWDKNNVISVIDFDRLNPLHDELIINSDLTIGVEEKLREIGFVYEITYGNNNGEFIKTENILLEKNYNNTFTENNVIEILKNIEIIDGLVLINIRQIFKK